MAEYVMPYAICHMAALPALTSPLNLTAYGQRAGLSTSWSELTKTFSSGWTWICGHMHIAHVIFQETYGWSTRREGHLSICQLLPALLQFGPQLTHTTLGEVLLNFPQLKALLCARLYLCSLSVWIGPTAVVWRILYADMVNTQCPINTISKIVPYIAEAG